MCINKYELEQFLQAATENRGYRFDLSTGLPSIRTAPLLRRATVKESSHSLCPAVASIPIASVSMWS